MPLPDPPQPLAGWLIQHWEMLTAWLGSTAGGVWYGFKKVTSLEDRMKQIEGASTFSGALQQQQMQEIKDICLDVRERLAAQERATAEFWRDRWPAVEATSHRVAALEKTVEDLQDDARVLRLKV